MCCTCACNIQDLLDCKSKKKKKSKSYSDSSTSSLSDIKTKHKSHKRSCNCESKSLTSDQTSTKSDISSVERNDKHKNAQKKEARETNSSDTDTTESKDSVTSPPNEKRKEICTVNNKKSDKSEIKKENHSSKKKSGDIGKSADQGRCRDGKCMSGTNTEKHQKNANVATSLEKTTSNQSYKSKDCPGSCTPRPIKGTSTPTERNGKSNAGLQLKDYPSTCNTKLWFEGDASDTKSKEKNDIQIKSGKTLNNVKDDPTSSCPAFCEKSPVCTDACFPRNSHSSKASKEKPKLNAMSAPTPIQAPLAKTDSIGSNKNDICSPKCPPSVLKRRPKRKTGRPDSCVPAKELNRPCQRPKSPKRPKSPCRKKKLKKRKCAPTKKTISSTDTDATSKSSKEITPKPSQEKKVESSHPATRPIPPQTKPDNSVKKELSDIDKSSLSKYKGLSICKCGATCQGDSSIKSQKGTGAKIYCRCTNLNNSDSSKKSDTLIKKDTKHFTKSRKNEDDLKTEKNKKSADDEIIKRVPCEANKSITNLPICKCPPQSKKKKGCEIMLVIVEPARRIK